MKGLDSDTCDDISLRLTGLIGIFDLIVDLTSGEKPHGRNITMLDFSFFISRELQGLYKTVSGIDYNS